MIYPVIAIVCGLGFLVWSADRFVDGAAATAKHFGMPTLLIGMLIVGFGTSAPEVVVSILASVQGNGGLAVGNALGSSIANIALILGVSALIVPLVIESKILKLELPILAVVTVLGVGSVMDGVLTQLEGGILLLGFAAFVFWSVRTGLNAKKDALTAEVEHELEEHKMPLNRALIWLVIGLVVMIVSSRCLVWGAVEVATAFGVSDLVIGLTVVAIGTSLPELASSIAAVRRGDHDMAFGNVIGSNMFNTLAVLGLAGAITPLEVGGEVFWRDGLFLAALTVSLFLFGYGFRGRQGRLNRYEGAILLTSFGGYTAYLLATAI